MKTYNLLATFVALLVHFVKGAPTFSIGSSLSSFPIKTILRFENEAWLENLAVRSNGNILFTRFDNHAVLYEVNPWEGSIQKPRVVAQFPQYKRDMALSGIVETEPDVFAFLVTPNRFDTANNSIVFRNGPAEVYKIDLNVDSEPSISLLTTISKAGFPNGMALIPGTHWILIGDSLRGLVYRVDSQTGKHSVVIRSHLMKYPTKSPLRLGINGVQVNSNGTMVYFANSARKIIARVPITSDGTPNGRAAIIAKTTSPLDDFSISENKIYVTTDPSNTLLRVDLRNGHIDTIAGNLNSSALPGPTAAHFGRAKEDRGILYVTCNGGLAAPINGTYTEGGSVKAIKIW